MSKVYVFFELDDSDASPNIPDFILDYCGFHTGNTDRVLAEMNMDASMLPVIGDHIDFGSESLCYVNRMGTSDLEEPDYNPFYAPGTRYEVVRRRLSYEFNITEANNSNSVDNVWAHIYLKILDYDADQHAPLIQKHLKRKDRK